MKRKFTLLAAALMLLSCLAVPLGMWGQTRSNSSSLVFTAKCNGSGTADDGAVWTVASDGTESNFDNTKGIHYGTGSAAVQYINLSTSDISGNISKVVVNASTANDVSATVSVTVGGSAFGGDPQSLSNAAAEYTFNGSASGEIVVLITKPSSATKALYCKSIEVTYDGSTPVDPSITFSNGSVYVGQTLDLNTLFSSNSNGAVSYSITSGDSYASITDNVIMGVSVGNVTVEASQSATASYNSATATATITVNEVPVLSSIAITTPPTKTTYVAGETFDASGMVVTATYSDASTDDVTASCTWTPSGALTTSDTEITVSYTESTITKTATQSITVNPYVQPTTIEINMNYQWLGSSNGGNLSNNQLPVVKIADNVTTTIAKGTSSTNPRGDSDYIRIYNGSTLTFDAPTGYEITSIVFTKGGSGTWNNPTVSTGTLSSLTWTGDDAASVVFTMTGSCFISKATITIAEPAPRYDITYANNLTNGAFASGNPTSAEEDETVTITTVPATGYHLATMTYNDGTSHNATVSGNSGSFTMPANAVEVSATFEPDPTYIITYVENGETSYTDENIPNGAIGNNLPDSQFNTVPANLGFVGWTTSTIGTYQTTLPTLVDENFNVTENVTFYAVYKYDYNYTTGGGTPTWTKVTDASTLQAGDQLVIACENYEAVAGDISSQLLGVEDAEFSNGIMTSHSSDAVEFVLGGAVTAWTFENEDGDKLGATAAKKMAWNNGSTTWSISINEGNATIANTTTSYGSIQYNYNSGNPRFTSYASTQEPVQLYRLEGGSTTVSGTYYLTSVTEHSTNVTVSVATTWTGNHSVDAFVTISSTGKLTVDGLLISPDEDAITIQNGGQLVTTSKGVAATVQKSIVAWTTTTPVSGWYFIASPINGNLAPTEVANMLTADVESAHTYDLYKYDATNMVGEESKPWVNYRAHSTGFVIANGAGYLYANAAAKTLEFSGVIKPYDASNNTVTLAKTGWNLIGNPFTCAVTVNKAFNEVNNGSAVTVKPSGSTINPCAGIAVNGNEGDVVTFTKLLSDEAPSPNNLNLVLSQQMVNRGESSSQTLDNAIVSFNEGNQLEKFYFGTQNANLYIPQGTEEYAIVSTEAQGEMPVSFRANENGQYTLTVNAENVEMNYLHLIDNMTGADIDLLQTPSYTFNAKTTDYESRFRLVFSANNSPAENGNETFAYFNGSEWMISNMGEATLQVVDVMGRVLSTETVNGNATINLNQTPGVYMFRLINGDSVKTQKIVVR